MKFCQLTKFHYAPAYLRIGSYALARTYEQAEVFISPCASVDLAQYEYFVLLFAISGKSGMNCERYFSEHVKKSIKC